MECLGKREVFVSTDEFSEWGEGLREEENGWVGLGGIKREEFHGLTDGMVSYEDGALISEGHSMSLRLMILSWITQNSCRTMKQ